MGCASEILAVVDVRPDQFGLNPVSLRLRRSCERIDLLRDAADEAQTYRSPHSEKIAYLLRHLAV